jgi:phosphatidylglycerol:prolipoprotein diacylglycerol transferase
MLPTLHLHVADRHVAVSLYMVALALGIGVGLVVAARRAARPDAVLVAAPIVALAGMLVAEHWHVALHASPGLSSMGGVAGGLVAAVVVARPLGLGPRALLDAIAPGALAGFAIGRVGCFLAGCCYGRPTTLAWGVVFEALGPATRHPVQLVEAALDLGVAWWSGRATAPGASAGRAMIGYALVRVLLEPLRDPVSADVVGRVATSAVHWCAIVLAAAGLALSRRPHDSARIAR